MGPRMGFVRPPGKRERTAFGGNWEEQGVTSPPKYHVFSGRGGPGDATKKMLDESAHEDFPRGAK